MPRPEILIIAGNDSSGLAGLQRDCATSNALGVHARTCISANTSQNTEGLQHVGAVPHERLTEQLQASVGANIKAIKIGLIANRSQVDAIANFIAEQSPKVPVICDPVFSTSANNAFQKHDPEFLYVFKTLLLPKCSLITPNIQEAEILTGIAIQSTKDVEKAAECLLSMGAKAVVIKGGHANFYASETVVDFFKDTTTQFWLSSEKQNINNTRGTGCTFASAIASSLALNYSLWDAVVIAKMTINQALRHSYALSTQPGPVNAVGFPNKQCDLPYLSRDYLNCDGSTQNNLRFPSPTLPSGEDCPLGLYPVVDNAQWIERLAPTGINTIQLRNKTLSGDALKKEISSAIAIANTFNIRLFINDYWQLAIELGAYGVHLGQEDLDTADLNAISKAGLRLGLSTHCHYEVARAHTFRPSYMACGPVFPTTSKDMPWVPHDLSGLQYWQHVLEYPLVAIGGISLERAAPVAKTGVSGVAMISAITHSDEPEQTTQEMMSIMRHALP